MKLRILFVTDHIHVPQGGGGGERNTHELCLALHARDAFVAVSLRADGSWLSWRSRTRRLMPPPREYSRDTGCGYPGFRGWDTSRIGEVVRCFGPDVAVVQSTHPEPLIHALAPDGIPLAAHFHEIEEIEHLRFLQDADIPVLANSNFTAARLLKARGLQCEVVLPLIDPRYYVTCPCTPNGCCS